MRTFLACMLIGIASAFVVGCGERSETRPEGPLRVVVTLPPLKGLVEPLLPEGSEVKVLLPPGANHHGWQPTPSDVASLSRADMVIYIGRGLEPIIVRHLNRHKTPWRRDVAFADLLGIELGHHHHHDHDHHDECDHGDEDPHLWLDPVLVKQFVEKLAPIVHEVALEAGRDADAAAAAPILARIDALDNAYRERLSPVKGAVIVTHHNAWSRLTDRYGLEVAEVLRPVDTAEPSAGDMERAARAVREAGVRGVFLEPQYSGRDAGVIRRVAGEAGVSVGVLDPHGTGDWFAMMLANLDELVRTLGGST